MDKFDVIVAGGGLAGLSAAYCLAKEGIGVLVIERGDYSGAKNVTGGRLYLNPIRNLLPVNWDEAPFERFVTKERITFVGESSSVTAELSSGNFRRKPYHSYTVLRAKFDNWLADKVGEAGGMVVTKNKVDDLIMNGPNVTGIVAGGDEIGANVVLAADGVMSLIAERAGLTKRREPENYAVGIKEIIELPAGAIEQRFNLKNGEGLAQEFVGAITKGMFGGGFLYTNLSSISLGLVIKIKDLSEHQPAIDAAQLLEEFKTRPEIQAYIGGGDITEYSAHVLPEAGLAGVPRLYAGGILVAGDAAGLALNTGITVRGMDFAIASGVFAARAIIAATKRNDFSARSLSEYETLLKNSFVLKDLETFRHAPEVLDNPRLMSLYPEAVCDIMEKLMYIGDQPKAPLSSTALGEVRRRLGFRKLLADAWKARRL